MNTTNKALAVSKAKWRSERISARRSGIFGMGAAPTARTVALRKAEGRRYRLGHFER